MVRSNDPFAVKDWGGDIYDRDVKGWSWRIVEGTTLGEAGVGSLKRLISQRATLILLIIFFATISILIARTIWLQGVQGVYWRGVAEGNRIRLEVVNASRGVIVDRQNNILANNVASFRLIAVPAELPKDEVLREEFLTSVLGGVPTELLIQDNITQLTKRSYLPLIIAAPLSHDMALQLIIKVGKNKGLRVEPSAERLYTGAEAIAHIMGYVGVVTQEEIDFSNGEYRQIDTKGKVGIESIYENLLRGEPGLKQVEVDASGLERKIFATRPAVAGSKLTLTVDSSLQSVAYDALKKAVDNNGKKGGSVVVIEPMSGEILALASYPSFDPNIFTAQRDSERIITLLNDVNKPLYNRVIAGEYPSGSTIKPLVASAALEESIITPSTTFLSTGGIYAGSQFFADWKAGGHGLTNVYKAIAESVNTFFYLIGGGSTNQSGLGITRLADYYHRFGLGEKTNIDLPSEKTGFVPDPTWKLKIMNDHWYRGDTYNISIGQGNLQVTPIQLAVAYGALATDGRLVEPHLLKQVTYPSGEIRTEAPLPRGNVGLKKDTLAIIQQAMRQTVTSGSARSLASLPVEVSGKTGTAQTGNTTNTHAWFAGYTSGKKNNIVIVALVENGGEGSSVAVPIAREVIGWYAQNYD